VKIGSKSWYGRGYDLGKMSMRELVAAYATHPAIQIYAALAAICVVAAVIWSAGPLQPLVAVLAVIMIYPPVEYLLHRFVLHGRWLYKRRITARLWKRIHFDHHQDPHRLDVLFGALPTTLPPIILIAAPVGWIVGGHGAAAAALAAGFVVICIYEFCHCIQHLNHKPSNRFLARIKQHHLAHHFHNEAGNFGITSMLMDRLCGTQYVNRRQVPRSVHVFDLGYDAEQARSYPWVAELSAGMPRMGGEAARVSADERVR
jgi:sterol desaturase/sphingolipid hydroxylase (fatty acid hydroxylase superfamily)